MASASCSVSADGRRFVLTEPVAVVEEKLPSIHVVMNWYEVFRGREQDSPETNYIAPVGR